VVRILFGISVVLILSIQLVDSATSQKERSIVSDDFTNKRPKSKKRTNSKRKRPRTYRLASTTLTNPTAKSSFDKLQVGVTIWKLQRSGTVHSSIGQPLREDSRGQYEWVARRVEADTQFREGDLLRLSIESPWLGYLYVVDRDWFTDDSSGETNLIFPARGEDNRLEAGKLIEIPAENQPPFKTRPKPGQAGELLTIIITSAPLSLSLTQNPLPISTLQLAQWEDHWSSLTERFEMNGGAGEARTTEEQQAASSGGTRQLTRDDPAPQTIYFLTPRSGDGLLFNLMLSYKEH
jgi:hypothetical protein